MHLEVHCALCGCFLVHPALHRRGARQLQIVFPKLSGNSLDKMIQESGKFMVSENSPEARCTPPAVSGSTIRKKLIQDPGILSENSLHARPKQVCIEFSGPPQQVCIKCFDRQGLDSVAKWTDSSLVWREDFASTLLVLRHAARASQPCNISGSLAVVRLTPSTTLGQAKVTFPFQLVFRKVFLSPLGTYHARVTMCVQSVRIRDQMSAFLEAVCVMWRGEEKGEVSRTTFEATDTGATVIAQIVRSDCVTKGQARSTMRILRNTLATPLQLRAHKYWQVRNAKARLAVQKLIHPLPMQYCLLDVH